MLKGKLGVSILFENSLVYNLVEPLRYVLTIEKKKNKKTHKYSVCTTMQQIANCWTFVWKVQLQCSLELASEMNCASKVCKVASD